MDLSNPVIKPMFRKAQYKKGYVYEGDDRNTDDNLSITGIPFWKRGTFPDMSPEDIGPLNPSYLKAKYPRNYDHMDLIKYEDGKLPSCAPRIFKDKHVHHS